MGGERGRVHCAAGRGGVCEVGEGDAGLPQTGRKAASRHRPRPRSRDRLAPMPVPIFVDRDGTLIEEVEFLASWGQIRIIPGVPEALAAANRAGHPVIVATNQSGVARGYFTE